MKVSLRWLSDFLRWNGAFDPWKNPDAVSHIADRLTESTAEVEHIQQPGELLMHTCVGQVLTVKKHPNADKLSLCDVQTDKGVKRVVCGGTNLREGMFVVFAHIGARVRWHGEGLMTLTKTAIRGEESEGMICAAEELDLQEYFPESTGKNIIDLQSKKPKTGQALKELLELDDIVLHIDNHAITHRPDLFSHIGFARECVALGLAKWKKTMQKKIKFPATPIPFHCHIEEKHLMPRYCACVITIDSLGETPDWMKKHLTSVGWRPVNLPVDITNFVASEVGVPLHSFDLDDLKGDIHMRKAQSGEKITTLDKKEFALPQGALILSDERGIFDLLGIMGGLRSSTKTSTRRIYLHAASLDPVSIRRTVIATGHRTDAATVYEKGVPNITTEVGFLRAVELFLQLIPGARLESKMESVGTNGKLKPLTLTQIQLDRTIGITTPSKKVTRIFTDLGFRVRQTGKKYSVTPPLWRLRDIKAPEDLTEEIARIEGYNRIPNTIPTASIALPARDHRIPALRRALKESGFIEIVPSSFVSATLLAKCRCVPDQSLKIENPLGEETSLLQPSTLPQLLVHAEKNILHAEDTLKTFTIAHVFASDGSEHEELGMLLICKKTPGLSAHPSLQLSSVIGHLLTCIEQKSSDEHMHSPTPIHPQICNAFGLPPHIAYTQIDLTALLRLPQKHIRFSSLPAFPAVTYDLTLPWSHQKSAALLLKKLRSASPLLDSIVVHDLFAKNPSDASYNLTLRCTYRSAERTLTEKEIQSEHDRLTKLALAS